MNAKLKKELEIQTQNFKRLIAEYCRLESVAAQHRMMKETADWVEGLLRETGFQTRQLEVEDAPKEHIRLRDIPRAIEFNAFMFTQLGDV